MPKRRFKRHLVTQPSDTSYRIIPLTKGKSTLVDAVDYEWLNQWNWSAWNSAKSIFYAARKQDGKTIYMHRFILQCEAREEADHINHDFLDNRRNNLRKCTSSQNKFNTRKKSNNTSGFKGVSWDKHRNKWMAKIRLFGKTINLGRYDSLEDAGRVYDAKARELFGEFSHTNSY